MPSFIILWLILDTLLVVAGVFIASCLAPACIGRRNAADLSRLGGETSASPVLNYARPTPRLTWLYRVAFHITPLFPILLGLALAVYLARLPRDARLPLSFVIIGFVLTGCALGATGYATLGLLRRIHAADTRRITHIRKRTGILTSILLVLFPLAAWGTQRWICWRANSLYEQSLAHMGLTRESIHAQREDLLAIILPRAKIRVEENSEPIVANNPFAGTANDPTPDRQAALSAAIAEIERNHGRAIEMMPTLRPMILNSSFAAYESSPGSATYDLPYLLLERSEELASDNPPEAIRCLRAWAWLVDDIASGVDVQSVSASLDSRSRALITLERLLPLVTNESQLSLLVPPRSLVESSALPQAVAAEYVVAARNLGYVASEISWLDWLRFLLPQGRNRRMSFIMRSPDEIFHRLFVYSPAVQLSLSDLQAQSERARRGELWRILPGDDPARIHNRDTFTYSVHLPEFINAIINSESQRTLWLSALEATRFRLQHGHLPANLAEIAQAGIPTHPPAVLTSRIKIIIEPSGQSLRMLCEPISPDLPANAITLAPK